MSGPTSHTGPCSTGSPPRSSQRSDDMFSARCHAFDRKRPMTSLKTYRLSGWGGGGAEAARERAAPHRCARREGMGQLYAGFCPAGRSQLGRLSLSGHCCQYPLAAHPQTRRGASSSAVWPCSERGLPGRPCHHGRRWALTPPFQPYRRKTAGGLLSVALSRGLPRVGVTHRSPLRSPDVPRHAVASDA